MNFDTGFCARAGWGPRDQTPFDLAARWVKLVARLQELDPIFAQWYVSDEEERTRLLQLDCKVVERLFAAGVGRDDDGTPQPLYGYKLEADNELDRRPGPRTFRLFVHGDANWKFAQSSAYVVTPIGAVSDLSVLNFGIFKGAVLALGESLGADSADAWPRELSDLWVRGREAVDLPIAWISYLGPAYAHLITPPLTAIVEHRPDGGLLMAATDETFSVDNPAHMAVARDIAAAVAPFNALPRPLGGGRFDERCLPIRD